MRIRQFLLVSAVVLPGWVASASHAAVIFNDTFEDGPGIGETATKADDAFDANDLAWYSSLSPASLAVVSDSFAGGSSAKALEFSNTDTFRRFGANFTPVTLGAAVGDRLVLSFDTRITSFENDTNTTGFRFGLHDSQGTNITSDNPSGSGQPSQQNDDAGYFVQFAVNTTASATIRDEPAGDNPIGGGTSGDDLVALNGSASAAGLTDLLKHTFRFEITRLASGVQLDLIFDDTTVASASDTTPFEDFDIVYFGQGSVDSHFAVDNVKLEAIPVPEPASLVLLGLGSLVLAGRSRRAGR